jgi:hypothetical protein
VVVVHNSTDQLVSCLTALQQAAGSVRAGAVVADSGSGDDPAAVCARFGVPFLPGVNRGMGATFNRALRDEHVRRARYVLQLNPDVVLPHGGLDGLVAVADRHPECGVLAPRQVDEHGALVCSIGVEPSPAAYWHALKGLPGDWICDVEEYDRERAGDWVMGACMLLRAEMLTTLGGFDERFFLCSEEVDLCRRAREADWSVLYTPEVTIVHPRRELPYEPHRIRMEEWSRILYMRKWNGLRARTSMRLALVARLAMLACAERSGAVSPRHALIRLRSALRFDRRGYGPARNRS